MHVLVVNIYFAPNTYGGATVVAEEVAFSLQRDHGMRVSVISAMARADLVPYAVMRVEVNGVAHFMINLPHGRSAAESDMNPQVHARVAELARALQPDLAHVHCVQELGAGCITALRGAGIPVILSVHDFWWVCERQFMMRPDDRYCGQDPILVENCRSCVSDIARTRARWNELPAIAATCDLVTYPSAFAKDLCLQSGLGHADRSVVWTNGIRLPDPGFAVRQAGRRAAGGVPVFGFLGGPSGAKGWPVTKAAFTAIGRDDFALHLVNGSPWGNWWDGHDLTGLRGTVRILPRFAQDAIDDFYVDIDCLLFLSQWKETFGLTIREAISRGIRVIQTDSGGTVEHPLADPEHLLPIGAPASRLVAELKRVLDEPHAHPAPVAVTSYASQAYAFIRFARERVASRSPA